MENMELDLSLKETLSVKRGTCPDCGGEVTFLADVTASKNYKCNICKMRFNVPNVNGIPGERLGE